ncbi:MAG TPA: hypothetical protein VGR30_10910 [Candidatus Binatia bacterium]|jgi:hypothetical protein|nr:hypothetical protein [Candidatus Binatia bacterium]
MQESLTHRPLPSFDENLRAFLEREISCELFTLYGLFSTGMDPDFDRWLEQTAAKKAIRNCLQQLYSDHGILPAPVLMILAKAERLLTLRPTQLKRQKRERQADIKTLEAALKLFEIYRASSLLLAEPRPLIIKEEMEREGAAHSYLKSLICAIGMIRTSKQPDREMRFCAQTLADFFRSVTEQPMHEHVGTLLKGSFPREWGASSDLRLAALHRTKGPSINARRSTLDEALALQRRDPEYAAHYRSLAEKWKGISWEADKTRGERRKNAPTPH